MATERKRPNRAPSSYRSSDPVKRQNQLANLRKGGGNVGWRVHGAYGRIASEQLDAKTREIFEAIAADAPCRIRAHSPPPTP